MNTHTNAIRAEYISKIYRLWHSPKHRLIFSLKNIWKKNIVSNYYREFYALDNTSFEIKKGESWGFIGVNGSGKSTLLKIIAGNLRPSTGFVEVEGKVAILDYSNGFHGDFTGKENIYIKATLLGLTRKQINERYDKIVEFAELGRFINQPIKTYSSGMVARLGFAIMTQVNADIIISDEALAVGDIFFVQKCMRFIHDFLKKGTFLFVSHSTNDVVSLCQKAAWLEHGKIKVIGASKMVAEAYLNQNKSTISVGDSPPAEEHLNHNKNVLLILGIPNNTYQHLNTFKDARLPHLIHHTHTSKFKKGHIQKAEIIKVELFDKQNNTLTQIIGYDFAVLSMTILAKNKVKSPIVGFQLYDRLGQIIIADVNYSDKFLIILAGGKWKVNWTIQMPLLPPGDYVFGVMVAEQEDENTIVIDAIHPALVVHSVTTGPRHGIAGVPMHSIKLKCLSVSHAAGTFL